MHQEMNHTGAFFSGHTDFQAKSISMQAIFACQVSSLLMNASIL